MIIPQAFRFRGRVGDTGPIRFSNTNPNGEQVFFNPPSSPTTMSDFVPGTETRPTGPPFPYRDQPYKALYVTYLIGKVMLSLPLWAVLSIPRSGRQSPNWSWTRSMGMRLIRMTDSVGYQ